MSKLASSDYLDNSPLPEIASLPTDEVIADLHAKNALESAVRLINSEILRKIPDYISADKALLPSLINAWVSGHSENRQFELIHAVKDIVPLVKNMADSLGEIRIVLQEVSKGVGISAGNAVPTSLENSSHE